MRLATLLLLAAAARAQFKSAVPLVVAPTSVTDAKGHYVDGLTTQDLVLYDNDKPQPLQMHWTTYPVDLVIAIQTSSNSGAVLDKLGGSGILFTQLVAADAGETAFAPDESGPLAGVESPGLKAPVRSRHGQEKECLGG